MGVFRKLTSLSTVGLVDFRSDKERIARSTRHTAKQAKEQTKLIQHQLDAQQTASLQAQAVAQAQMADDQRVAQEAQFVARAQMNLQQQVARQALASALTSDVQRQAILQQVHQQEQSTQAIASAENTAINYRATPAARILQLDSLLAQGLISQTEHAETKRSILESI